MSDIHHAIIVITMPDGIIHKKSYIGTEDQVYEEGQDWYESLALKYIFDRNITDSIGQAIVMNATGLEFVWEKKEILKTIYMVVEEDGTAFEAYDTRADAEEAIFTECEDFAYEVMMNDDPMDAIGEEEWNYREDWRYLMRDAGRSFSIQKVKYWEVQ